LGFILCSLPQSLFQIGIFWDEFVLKRSVDVPLVF